MTLVLTRSEVAGVLSLDDCITAVEEVFRAYGGGSIAAPRTLELHGEEGGVHVKAALTTAFVAKMNANFPGNPARRGLPTIQGVIVVVDAADGSTAGILDSSEITTLRTAAASGVAAKYLARRDARTVTIAGCGVQGRVQLEAMTRVRSIAKAFAHDSDPAAAERFARDMSRRLGIEVFAAADLEAAVRASDIVITCTPAKRPLLDARHLRPGLFIAGVGADNPEKHELAPDLLARSLVVADLLDQSAAMGDLHHAIEAGVLKRDDVYAELAEVVTGKKAARTSDDQTFVFDSTGTALQDAAAATIALTRARERGIGRSLDLRS